MFKILVIEESAPLRELYRHDFESEGYEVLTTGSSREGLRMLEKASPDLVIIDAHTGDMNGLEAMGQLLSHCPRIPVVVNSALSTYEDNFICRAADAFITKSADTLALRDQIRKLVAPDAA